jgi:hypothetical protein
MVGKIEDTNYRRYYVSGEDSQGDQKWWTLSDSNPTVDRATHNGADVSIGTQSEEERMQRYRIHETPEESDA